MSFDRVVPQGTGTAKAMPSVPPAKSSAPSSSTAVRSGVSIRSMSPAAESGQLPPTKNVSKQGTTMNSGVSLKVFMGLAVMTLVFGVASGIAGAYMTRSSGPITSGGAGVTTGDGQQADNAVRVGAVFGVPDEKTFRDDTEGVLIVGGLDGEGSHTLLRPGGESQNVYLTSSVVDLDQFKGMKLRVWGETFKGQKAGWLMDVGRVEVLELKAETPSWYKE